MDATWPEVEPTMPSPTPDQPPASPPRKRGRPRGPNPRDRRVGLAFNVMVAMAALPPTPEVADLAAELGWAVDELARVLDAMERCGLIERWREGATARVMLSAVALGRLGLRLAPRGDRWRPVVDLAPVLDYDGARPRDVLGAGPARRSGVRGD
jgi:hypothetical protein